MIYWAYLRQPNVKQFLGIEPTAIKGMKLVISEIPQQESVKEKFFCRYCGAENKLRCLL